MQVSGCDQTMTNVNPLRRTGFKSRTIITKTRKVESTKKGKKV
jgi:hypothetical protein